MQEKNTSIIQLRDNLKAFVEKLQNWRQKVVDGNICMFDRLSSCYRIDEQLKTLIIEHVQSMESEFHHYFPELKEQEATLSRNPFSNSLDVCDIPDEIQEQFIKLKNDSTARDIYHEKSLSQFWCDMSESYIKNNRNWHFEYCCPSLRHTCVSVDFLLFYISKLRKETE